MVKIQNVFTRKTAANFGSSFQAKISFFLTKQSVGTGEQIINITY